MVAKKRFVLEFTADAKKAAAGVKEVDKGMASLSTQAKRLGTSLASGFALDRIVNFGKQIVGAAEESQKVAAQTDAVLKSMGLSATVAADDIAGLADEISKKTGIDDEAIQSSQNLLLTFGQVAKSAGQAGGVFERATLAATDLSVAFGKDLASSTIMVGKALNDPIAGLTALNRVGVQFTAQQKEQIKAMVETGNTLGAQTLLLEELEAQVGGSAEAQATATDKMKVAWENVQEEMGTKLLPIVNSVSDAFTGLLEGPAGGLAAGIGAVGVVVGGLGAAAGTAIGPIRTAREALASMGTAGAKTDVALGKLGRGLAKGGLVVGGMLLLKEALDQVFGEVGPVAADAEKLATSLEKVGRTGQVSGELANVAGEDWGKLRDAFNMLNKPGILDQAESSVDSFVSTVTLGLADQETGVESARQKWEDFDTALAGIATEDPAKAFELLTTAAEGMGISVDSAKSKLPEYSDAVDAAKNAANDAATPTDEYGRSLDEVGDSAAEAADLVQEYSDTLRATFDPLFGAINAQDKLAESQQGLREAQADLNTAVAEHGVNSDQAREAQEKLTDAEQTAREAVIDLDSAAQELNTRIADGTVKVDEARSRFITMATQMGFTSAEADAMADQFGLTTAAAQTLGATDPNVQVTQTGAAPTRDLMNRVTAAVNAIPGRKTVTISADGNSAIVTANGVKRYIDGLTGRIRIVSYTVPGTQTFGGRQAEGGVVPQYMQAGGINWNPGPGPRGTDTVPAWLTPGEMILTKDHQRTLFNAIDDGRLGGGSQRIAVTLGAAPGGDRAMSELVMYLVRRGVIQLNVNGQQVAAGR
jgi:hypothetical protein